MLQYPTPYTHGQHCVKQETTALQNRTVQRQLTRQVLLFAGMVPVRAWRSAGQDKSWKGVHKATLQQAAAAKKLCQQYGARRG
jgi:hypothetical protein